MNNLAEYLGTHPFFLAFVFGSLLVVAFVIRRLLTDEGDDSSDYDDNHGGGGPGNLPTEDPVLDLPPGVTLPIEDEDSVLMA